MNTLWVFGDSFSWDHKIRFNSRPSLKTKDDHIWKYISEYLEGTIFESWGEIVSKKLNMNYINHAGYQTNISIKGLPSGNTNNSNVNLLHELSHNFKKDDIVIFGFTDICRFEWVNSEGEILVINSSNYDTDSLPNQEKEQQHILNKIILNRDSSDFYQLDILQKLKGIETLSNLIGFKLWYWDWSGCFDKLVSNKTISDDRWIFFKAHPTYSNYQTMIYNEYPGGNIYWETNGNVPDGHLGKIGNKIHGNILVNFLKK